MAESSDDEDPDQSPVIPGQSNDSPSEGAPTITQVAKQPTHISGRDQHAEVVIPAVTPASRESSPTLSVDIPETGSIDSRDSSRSPDASTPMETPPALLVDPLAARIANRKDTTQDSASHDQPKEPLSLTDLGSDGPAATEAVRYLVQAVGRDVVSFRRNTQVSYMVVERAREIVKAINEYIFKVENSTTGDWDSFEKFTVAIEPFEE